jgi:hypothetical protein
MSLGVYREVTRDYIQLLEYLVLSVTNLTAILDYGIDDESLQRLFRVQSWAKAVVYASHTRFARIQARQWENPLSLGAIKSELGLDGGKRRVDGSLETGLALGELQLPDAMRDTMAVHEGYDLLNPMLERARVDILTFGSDTGRDGVEFSERLRRDVSQHLVLSQQLLARIRSNVEVEVPTVFLQHTQLAVVVVLTVFLTLLLWVEVGFYVLLLQPLLLYVYGGLYVIAMTMLNPFEKRTHNYFVGKDLNEYMHREAQRIDHDVAVFVARARPSSVSASESSAAGAQPFTRIQFNNLMASDLNPLLVRTRGSAGAVYP